jgi:hypothetical protein
LATLAGFYLVRHAKQSHGAADDALPEAYVLGTLAVLVWAGLPMLVFIFASTYESAMRMLQGSKLFVSGFGMLGLTFFFTTRL